eukprot:scaffold170549_cov39-Prasinocladus_malaysianus.AAC.1
MKRLRKHMPSSNITHQPEPRTVHYCDALSDWPLIEKVVSYYQARMKAVFNYHNVETTFNA